MSASGSSSDGSSLAGFGAELEAELLGDSGFDGGGAAAEAQARELSGAADAFDDDVEPDAKRTRVEDATNGARVASGVSQKAGRSRDTRSRRCSAARRRRRLPAAPGLHARHVYPLLRAQGRARGRV